MARPPRKEVEARVLAAIDDLIEVQGLPPTFRELGAHLGMAHGAVHDWVARLRQAGLVNDQGTQRARSLYLTPAGREYLAARDGLETAG